MGGAWVLGEFAWRHPGGVGRGRGRSREEGTPCRLWGGPSPGLSRDPAPSPDANRNVVSQPSALLVVLLNVSLNTLPVLAFRIIYQALKKPHPKVKEAGVPTAPSWNPSLCREQVLQGDMGLEAGVETQTDAPCPQGAILPGVEKARPVPALLSLGFHQELSRTWGSR